MTRRGITPGARGCGFSVALLCVLSLAGPLPAAAATTYYVRAGGNDDNDGLTAATALASVRPAARRLREPGDRLIVGPGTYREGNISPFGNGTPEAPIVLLGDASGAATGDPPGPVLILPPNTPKADSGFLIRGRNDVVIEGFEIVGAHDAGIEVRARRRTGAESTRLALRNNRVRGSRVGMQISAVGDIEVSGNHLIGPGTEPKSWAGDGMVVRGGSTATMRLRLIGNVFEDCFIGLRGGDGMAETLLDSNEMRTRARNMQFGSDKLTLTGNRFLGPLRSGELSAKELVATDNQFVGSIAFGATDVLELERNFVRGSAGIRRSPARARIAENAIADLSIGGGGMMELDRNEGRTIKAKEVETLVATGNRFTDVVNLRVADGAHVDDNEAGRLVVRAGTASVQGNTVARQARVAAADATVVGNTVGALAVQIRRRPEEPPAAGETLVVRDNAVAGDLTAAGAATITIHGNTVGGAVRTIGREAIDVVDNDARGITCAASTTATDVTLRENRSRQSAGPGLAVIGAAAATIADNVVTDNAGAGLVVRRVARLVVTGNELRANRQGGAAIRVPPTGDCNEDMDVTIVDLMRVVGILLQRTALHYCDAADTNRDRQVTVDELVLGVGAALGRSDPLASSVELRANVVEDNLRRGLDVYARAAITATDNRILRNEGCPLAIHGLGPLGETLVAGNLLGGGTAEGLLVEAVDRAVARDNVVFDNHDAGILLRASPGAAVTNNLVYANGGPGIAVGLGDNRPSSGVQVGNNTVFNNGGWGIAVGAPTVASTGTVIRDNIIDQNVGGGLAVVADALTDLTVDRNVNTGGYSPGVPPGETDLDVDPLFVDSDGADGILGGDGYADDDFHLQPDSPADGLGFRYPKL